jgi:RND family efflux transporter MFP subunit
VVDDDPIYAYFNVSELDLLPILRHYAKDPTSKPSGKVPVFLGLADETGYPHEGHFDFAETMVDASTGTIQVRGKFPNPDGLLMPGMYVRVRVPVEKRLAWLVPDVAVQFDQGGKYVLVVDNENNVQQKRIKMGEQVDEMRVIAQGLAPNDRVIVTGTQRARPGFKVNPVANQAASPQPDAVNGKTQEK